MKNRSEDYHLKVLIILVLSAIIIVNSVPVYASHGSGSGGGGGCSGDCTPPTLGLDEKGKIRVVEGLKINSNAFEVEDYSQTIKTQILEVGDKNTMELRIYENTSPDYLSHVEIHFDVYKKVIEGITVEESTASII